VVLLTAGLVISLIVFLTQFPERIRICPLMGCPFSAAVDMVITYSPLGECPECIFYQDDPRLARTPLVWDGERYYMAGHELPLGKEVEFSIFALTLNPWRLDELRVRVQLHDAASMESVSQPHGNWLFGYISERVWPSPVALLLLALDAWLLYRFRQARRRRGAPAGGAEEGIKGN
jgi:hypothetical protein